MTMVVMLDDEAEDDDDTEAEKIRPLLSLRKPGSSPSQTKKAAPASPACKASPQTPAG